MTTPQVQVGHVRLDAYKDVGGAVVVIDVIRAFTTAAFAFAAGARDILLVSGVDEALSLRSKHPGSLVMGEVNGLPPAGFDFGNSPAALLNQDLRGKRLIQRTGAGTQGAVRCKEAPLLMAASFVCARSTLEYLRRSQPPSMTFVATAHDTGDEDLACAEYLGSHARGTPVPAAPFLQRVRDSAAAKTFLNPAMTEFNAHDIELCTQLNRFAFAMVVQRREGMLVLEAVPW